MTDIGRMAHLAPARTQLAVDTYFDQARFKREQESIFEQFSRYVGHQKSVPQPGDWRSLSHENNGQIGRAHV